MPMWSKKAEKSATPDFIGLISARVSVCNIFLAIKMWGRDYCQLLDSTTAKTSLMKVTRACS